MSIIQDAISSDPFNEWSRLKAKHYNIKAYGKYLSLFIKNW